MGLDCLFLSPLFQSFGNGPSCFRESCDERDNPLTFLSTYRFLLLCVTFRLSLSSSLLDHGIQMTGFVSGGLLLLERVVMETFVVTFEVSVIHLGYEIRDGIIKGLHFGQEMVHRRFVNTTSGIVSEFNQGFFVGRGSEFTNVYF